MLECVISGSAINSAEVWNRRWRPLAVHCKWESSKKPNHVVLAIHENTIYTTDVHMYQGIGKNPKATLFWGEQDALTFEYKWENKKEINILEGINNITLNSLISGKKYFYQIQIMNNEGITWMMDTQSFTTK